MRNRVIIVEDEETILNFLEMFIRREGFEVLSFTNPLEARKHIEGTDIVVTDIEFPEHSKKAMEEFLVRCIETGAAVIIHSGGKWEKRPNTIILTKPVDVPDIISAVRLASEISEPERFSASKTANPIWHPEPPSKKMMLRRERKFDAIGFWESRRELEAALRLGNVPKRELDDMVDRYDRTVRRMGIRHQRDSGGPSGQTQRRAFR